MSCEHNGICGGGRLHAQEHAHGSDGTANSGTVLHEGAEGFDEVNFLTVVVELSVLVTADGDVLDHQYKEDKADNAHDQGCPEYLLAQQDLNLAAGQGAEDLVASLIQFASQGVLEEVFRNKLICCVCGDLDLIQEPSGVCGIKGNLLPDQHGQNDAGKHAANSTADGTEHGKLCSLAGIFGNNVKHRAVGNVCHGVSSIPNDVAQNEENCLNNGSRSGEGQEHCSAANQKADCTDQNVGLVLANLVLSSVAVDEGTD